MHRTILSIILLISLAGAADAGLHYSAESYAALPSQWRGFLMDHRLLRNIAIKPKTEAEAPPLRMRYREEATKLQAKPKLTPDELADLGALHMRLGEVDRALDLLRKAHEANPNHFAIAANLGTAWHLLGEFRQAEAALEVAVRLAPGKLQLAEEAHLKLVRLRLRGQPGELDDLFGVRYVSDKDGYEPGKIAAIQMKKLPAHAVPLAQQLALWFPADGPLLWQLAELANAHGDVRTAANMMEGCVTQFSMNHATLRKHRQVLRDAIENVPAPKIGEEHIDKFTSTLTFRSRRPLLSKQDALPLPAIDPKGVNAIPWELFGETSMEKPFKVRFPKYLQELEGKQISMTGYMYPLGEDLDLAAFLFIESPVGCWYCEMPETTGILFVEMPRGKTTRYQQGLVRVVGRMALNATDPEDFLYAVRDARVGALD